MTEAAAQDPKRDDNTETTCADEESPKDEKAKETETENTEKRAANETAKTDDDGESVAESAPKKAKIAMPPAVSSSLVDVDKYKLDAPLSESEQPSDDDVEKKITSPCLILFGLHPLIREAPLKKMCEDYGNVVNLTVRSAFANRYGHVEFETIEEARNCYKALNGAKLLHKAILVQPGKAEPKKPVENEKTEEAKTEVAATG
jgi:RNA recognition motif. (a.k.a. RRM, RBD, or RNP domain)